MLGQYRTAVISKWHNYLDFADVEINMHGTAGVIEIGAPQIPWNSMELLASSKLAHLEHMELLVSAKLAHSKFNGIPWNCSCQRYWRIPSSMEFHGIPWNCSRHRNWRTWNTWNFSCQRNWRILSSMEYHGTALVSDIGAFQVPWNSMEFHGTARVSEISALQVPWNSTEFHGTAHVSEIGAPQVPWNSMELLMSSKLAHS